MGNAARLLVLPAGFTGFCRSFGMPLRRCTRNAPPLFTPMGAPRGAADLGNRVQKNRSMKRQIGILGTTARIIIGVWLFGSVLYGHLVRGPFRPLPWVIGLIVFPAVFITWQYLRARRNPTRLEANSPIATVLNVVIFFAFYFTFVYAPSIDFMSDAVLIFYGLSMLLAALRGYGGCESLAISNWLLKRDDQIGCLFFSPVDNIERKVSH